MTGKTHLGGGILASVLLCSNDLLSASLLILGSLLPDIDHAGSIIGKKVPILPSLLKHRGITHSLLFALAMYFINPFIGFGCVIHDVMDMMTKNGVELLYPLKTKIRFPLAKYVRTGGDFETILSLITYVLAILCI